VGRSTPQDDSSSAPPPSEASGIDVGRQATPRAVSEAHAATVSETDVPGPREHQTRATPAGPAGATARNQGPESREERPGQTATGIDYNAISAALLNIRQTLASRLVACMADKYKVDENYILENVYDKSE
jgi:hypothetical protein